MNLRSLTLFLLTCSTVMLGMAAIVTGTVIDKGGEPAIGAGVRLLSLPDSTFTQAATTDYDGVYRLDSVHPGRYCLQVSVMDAKKDAYTIKVESETDTLEINPIRIDDKTVMLDDVVVKAVKAAVIAKEDTIEYNASSYRTKQNAVVEDLLKKLPGVEVGSDGSITSGGKTISKILVDGEEFFSDDPKMASKNLPADMVDKVQIVDSKSDLAKLTGVDDGEEETVINLTIKKGMKNGWFGKVMAGYGTDKRYNAGFNISHFRDNNQLTIIGGTNNVNDLTFTDTGRGRFRNFGGDDGITTCRSLGLNFSVGRTEKFRVGGNVLYTNSEQDYRKRSETQYTFPDSVSYQNGESASLDKGHNVRADLRLQWQIDANNTLDFRPRFSFNHRDSFRSDTTTLRAGDPNLTKVNHQDNFQSSKGNSYQASGDLIFSHKFASKAGRSLSFQGKYDFSDTRQKSTSWSEIAYYLLSADSEKLYRFIDSRQWSNAVEGRVTYVEPLGDPKNGNFLNLAYKVRYSFNNSDRYTYNLNLPQYEDAMTEALFKSLSASAADGTLDTDLSNNFRNDYFTQELQVSYKKVHSMYNLEAGMIFSPSMSRSKDLINSARNIEPMWVYNVAPFLRFQYKFSKQSDLRVDYRARTTAPSLTQLQPVADTSDPLHITIGNPELKPTFTQSLMAGYHGYNVDSQRMLMGMMMLSHTLNGIVSRTISDPTTGVQTTDYVNVNNGLNINMMGMINQQIPNSRWRLAAQLFAGYSNSPGYIDGVLNRAGNLSLRPQLTATYTLDIFQLNLSPNYSLQYAHNSLPGRLSQTVHSYGFSGDASLFFNFGLDVTTDIDFARTSGYAASYNSNQWLWNAQVSYSFLSNKSLTVALKVYDILQQKKSISRVVTASYISDQQVNALTRYAMLTLTYSFQTFKGSTSQVSDDFDDHPGPPPGEEGGGRAPGGNGGGNMPPGPPPGM